MKGILLRYGGFGLSLLLLSGCNMALLDPKGAVGMQERSLILTALGLMLIVVIPVICMTIWFAWRYRASNKAATYKPDWSHSNKVEAVVWGIPCVIILILGTLTWVTTHNLDPRQPLNDQVKPLEIQVVSLDWKWLFIYPEQGIATVNEISFPVDVPVHFKVTSGSVMNSFFIPQLGSQIYAMAGMRNQLNLIANEPGVYRGISANYSGHGFSGMKFNAIATSPQEFEHWVAKVKQSSLTLQMADYQQLTKPTMNHAVAYYGSVKPHLYDDVVALFMDMGSKGEASMPMMQSDAGDKAPKSQDDMDDDMGDMTNMPGMDHMAPPPGSGE